MEEHPPVPPSKTAYGLIAMGAVAAWLAISMPAYFCNGLPPTTYNGTVISLAGLAGVLTTLYISFSVRTIETAQAKFRGEQERLSKEARDQFEDFQRMVMSNQVRPLLRVHSTDFEDDIGVLVVNDGLGPAIVTRTVVRRIGSVEAQSCDLVDLLPDIVGQYADFTIGGLPDVVPVGGHAYLVRWRGHGTEEWAVNVQRAALREALADVVVSIEYQDLHGTILPPAAGRLTPFLRHAAPATNDV